GGLLIEIGVRHDGRVAWNELKWGESPRFQGDFSYGKQFSAEPEDFNPQSRASGKKRREVDGAGAPPAYSRSTEALQRFQSASCRRLRLVGRPSSMLSAGSVERRRSAAIFSRNARLSGVSS